MGKEKKRKKLDEIVLGLSAAKEQKTFPDPSLPTSTQKKTQIPPSVSVIPTNLQSSLSMGNSGGAGSGHHQHQHQHQQQQQQKPFTITVTTVPGSEFESLSLFYSQIIHRLITNIIIIMYFHFL